MALVNYFKLEYYPGWVNIDADALSRRPHPCSNQEDDWIEVPGLGVKANCRTIAMEVTPSDIQNCAAVMLGVTPEALPNAYVNLIVLTCLNWMLQSLREPSRVILWYLMSWELWKQEMTNVPH